MGKLVWQITSNMWNTLVSGQYLSLILKRLNIIKELLLKVFSCFQANFKADISAHSIWTIVYGVTPFRNTIVNIHLLELLSLLSCYVLVRFVLLVVLILWFS